MKTIPKVQRKIVSSIMGKIMGAGSGAALLGGVPFESLIAWYKGTTSTDGTELLASSGNHSGQVKGTSVEGDGTGIGTITGLLTSATFTVGTGSDSPTCTVAGQLDVANNENVWDLKIYHTGVLFADLAMICLGSTTEYSATPGLPDCVWSGFGSDPIVEHTDGTGSSRANVDGYSLYQNNFLYSRDFVNEWDLVSGTTIVQNHVGIDGTINTATTLSGASGASGVWLFSTAGVLGAVVGDTITIIAWIKKTGSADNGLRIRFSDTTNCVHTFYGDGNDTSGAYESSSITDMGDWYKCTVSKELQSVNARVYLYFLGAVGANVVIGQAELYFNKTIDEITDYPYTITIGSIVPQGRKPVGFQALTTQYPGPIAADGSFVNMPCLLGDGTGYVALSSDILLTRDFICVFTFKAVVAGNGALLGNGIYSNDYIRCNGIDIYVRFGTIDTTSFAGVLSTTKYTTVTLTASGGNIRCTTDRGFDTTEAIVGVGTGIRINWLMRYSSFELEGHLYNLKLYNASNELIHHYPMEGGHPTHNPDITMVEDVVGGNHGVATGFTGTCWGERDEGDFALAKGFSVDRVAGYGYSPVNPLTGLLQGGGTPTYKKNQWDTVLALPASFKGALGPEMQALESFTAEAELTRLVDQPYNVNDQEFTGNNGAAYYSSAQDEAARLAIAKIINEVYYTAFDGEPITFDSDLYFL